MKKNKGLLMATLSILTSTAALAQAPTVVTDTRFARGATQAFGRGTWTANGATIYERGFCYSSTNPQPTIEDEHSMLSYSNNGRIYRMEGLTPATIYYARAYGMTKDSLVGYGDVIKFCTLPQGTITWSYDNGGSDDENTRINSAVGDCADYWNNLTSITGLNLSVHYGASTPTADCSYGGWMRVGPSSSYQKTGTIMHEALHAIGVGTVDLWYGSASPMRGGSGTGLWLGDRATELVRFWDNSTVENVTGDATHVWATGGSNMSSFSVNGANEDTGTATQYTAVSLMAQALCEDGLPPTSGHPTGLPYYSFTQEDTIKYYLKNESESYGLYSSYLVETADGTLQWQEMKSAAAAANDSAAWFVRFTPATQYYQLVNVATGHSLRYASDFVADNGTAGNSFQLMRSRTDVTMTDGTLVTSQRGYWIISSDGSNCLGASANGAVTALSFNISNSSQRQRWLILTARQAAEMEDSGLLSARNSFRTRLPEVEALAAVPHHEMEEGADELFTQTLASLSNRCDNAASATEVTELIDALDEAAKTFLSAVCVNSADTLFDLTFMVTNPDFSNSANGWAGTVASKATCSNNEVEFYQISVSAQQVLSAMPIGTYRVGCQGFQRPGSYSTVYTDYVGGTDNAKAKLYVGSATDGFSYLLNIMADRSQTSLHSKDVKMSDGTYIPNDMASAAAHFEAGAYQNTAEYHQSAAVDLKVGLVGTNNTGTSFWTCVTNFHLWSYGNTTPEALGVTTVGIQSMPSGSAYDLSGCRKPAGVCGMQIRNGKIMFVK